MVFPSISYERNFFEYNLKCALYKSNKRENLLQEVAPNEEYTKNLDSDVFLRGYHASQEEEECYAYWTMYDLIALHRIGQENSLLNKRSWDK